MKHLSKSLLVLISILIGGCDNSKSSSSSSSSRSATSEVVVRLDYSDVKDKFILWSNIFGIDEDSYYVYFFSRTCSHCSSLKQFILEKAIELNDIYFVENCEEVVFVNDVSSTIGLTSVENFGIYGFPSIIKIEDKAITKNIAGNSLIRSELSIE